ncbi:MAG: response regulator transcription factor [Candidatus Omnitrophica bacterium]|nr:response regulator transcription factor [Candidatus Omnitrophota bacterium]
MKKVLVIEDEKNILKGLMDNLKAEGFDVIGESIGKNGLATALGENVDLILLDLMLPDMSGLDICREIKKKKISVPIIMLTAKSKESDKILGLELGADDYITKPFSVNEVIARIRAVLRRVAVHDKAKKEKLENYEFDDIKVDFVKYEAWRGKKLLKLSKREFEVLEYFIKRKGEVVTRNDLLDVVWGYETFPTTRTVDNFVARIRKQIEKKPADPQYLLSIRGAGYKFTHD